MPFHKLWPALACLLLLTASASAAELLPAEIPVEQAIDQYMDAKLAAEGVTPVGQASDLNLVRRLTLDLAGRIPLVAEARAYAESTDPAKRLQLVDRLMAAPDFALHQRNQFHEMLLPQSNDGPWRDYLLQAFQEGRTWDVMFRDILLAREEDEKSKGPIAYLKTRAKDLDDLTNDTSKLFFGVSINCAKCHDHPLVLDWRQDHYFGMTSFFNRTQINRRNQLVERDEGIVKFKTTEGEEKTAQMMFLTGASVEEPVPPMLTEEQKKEREKLLKEEEERKEGPAPPAPEFSRRKQLVELALRSEDNYFFSRSIVNRLFAQMMGRGLVMPLDQMHSQNPPSHPELMDWLARDLVTHGYDLRRIVRGIALSQAYSRSSQWGSEGEPPPDHLFAVGRTKPLTPRQYSLSLTLASRAPDRFNSTEKPEEWTKQRTDLDNHSGGFASNIEAPSDNFQVSVSEALLFSNGDQVQNSFLGEGGDMLVGRLKTLMTPAEQVQTAFWSVYSRPADSEEEAACVKYLAERTDRPVPALQQLLWSLLSSSEARFNY